MTDEKQIQAFQVRLPTDLHQEFQELCQRESLSTNQALQDLVKASITTKSIDKIKAYAIVAADMPGVLCFMKDLADAISRTSLAHKE